MLCLLIFLNKRYLCMNVFFPKLKPQYPGLIAVLEVGTLQYISRFLISIWAPISKAFTITVLDLGKTLNPLLTKHYNSSTLMTKKWNNHLSSTVNIWQMMYGQGRFHFTWFDSQKFKLSKVRSSDIERHHLFTHSTFIKRSDIMNIKINHQLLKTKDK